MIEYADITVIVQGPVLSYTRYCLESIRKVLPKASIILSTWNGSDVRNLEFDALYTSKDPGGQKLRLPHCRQRYMSLNLNRQLISTKKGLQNVKTKYALKLRSDLVLDSASFLSFYEIFPKRSDKFRLFKQRIAISSVFTRYLYTDNKKTGRMPFHFSDFFFFGLTEDLKTYFDNTSLISEDFLNYFENRQERPPYRGNNRFTAEQYFAVECFKRNFPDAKIPVDASDIDNKILEESEQFLMNNFITLDFQQSGIHSLKYPFTKNEILLGIQYEELYNFLRFEKLYKKLIDQNYRISTEERDFKSDNLKKSYYILQKRIYNVFYKKNTQIYKKIGQLLFDLPIAFLMYIFYKLFFFIKCKLFN